MNQSAKLIFQVLLESPGISGRFSGNFKYLFEFSGMFWSYSFFTIFVAGLGLRLKRVCQNAGSPFFISGLCQTELLKANLLHDGIRVCIMEEIRPYAIYPFLNYFAKTIGNIVLTEKTKEPEFKGYFDY